MNDLGQIAFRYGLANGERGIAFTRGFGSAAAEAVPEPGTLTLAGAAEWGRNLRLHPPSPTALREREGG
jgi:hypothetical protein